VVAGFLAGLLGPSTKVQGREDRAARRTGQEKAKETGQEAVERGKQVAGQAAESAKEAGRERAEQLKDN
jgi:anti-sigma28 factor (negative regulator of flagellin synthesis)